MPEISIIIPTFNRAAQLARALRSIAGTVGAADPVEIIVVDNASTDATEATYKKLRADFPKHEWRYIYEAMPGLLSGRHCGAKHARGEILAFIDDDVALTASWLDGLMQAFSTPLGEAAARFIGITKTTATITAKPPKPINARRTKIFFMFTGIPFCGESRRSNGGVRATLTATPGIVNLLCPNQRPRAFGAFAR